MFRNGLPTLPPSAILNLSRTFWLPGVETTGTNRFRYSYIRYVAGSTEHGARPYPSLKEILRPGQIAGRLDSWHPTCLNRFLERKHAFVPYSCVCATG
jgi:hypothetical protein